MITLGLVKAKAVFYVITDAKGRRLGSRKGLVTLVVLAENDECHRLGLTWSINESVSISPQE